MTTVAEALRAAQAGGLDRIDAHGLLAHLLGRPRAWLIAHDHEALPAAAAADFAAACARRRDGVPLAYLTGEREFHGLRLRISDAVLVPRDDTEVIVDWALALLPALPMAAPRVLDLGTGSGAIALAVAHCRPAARVTATDISAAAIAVAEANARRLALPVNFAVGPWWLAVPAGEAFDLVLANPPYIAGDDRHLEALRHEPRLALTPGGDGLGALREIVAGAGGRLAPGGCLLLEHGRDQAQAVVAMLREAGLQVIGTRVDIEGRPRCTAGRSPDR